MRGSGVADYNDWCDAIALLASATMSVIDLYTPKGTIAVQCNGVTFNMRMGDEDRPTPYVHMRRLNNMINAYFANPDALDPEHYLCWRICSPSGSIWLSEMRTILTSSGFCRVKPGERYHVEQQDDRPYMFPIPARIISTVPPGPDEDYILHSDSHASLVHYAIYSRVAPLIPLTISGRTLHFSPYFCHVAKDVIDVMHKANFNVHKVKRSVPICVGRRPEIRPGIWYDPGEGEEEVRDAYYLFQNILDNPLFQEHDTIRRYYSESYDGTEGSASSRELGLAPKGNGIPWCSLEYSYLFCTITLLRRLGFNVKYTVVQVEGSTYRGCTPAWAQELVTYLPVSSVPDVGVFLHKGMAVMARTNMNPYTMAKSLGMEPSDGCIFLYGADKVGLVNIKNWDAVRKLKDRKPVPDKLLKLVSRIGLDEPPVERSMLNLYATAYAPTLRQRLIDNAAARTLQDLAH
jgi:hypothetical protein